MNRVELQLLRTLLRGSKDFWELASFQDESLPEYIETLKNFKNKDFIEENNGIIKLTKKGKEFSSSNNMFKSDDYTCPACSGKGIKPKGRILEILTEFEKLSKGRPEVTADFDQGVVPLSINLDRLAYIYERGDLENKSIFILGDDDLLSIGIALLGLSKRIVVVEIDKRINNFLRKIIKQKGFENFEVYDYDARLPVQEGLTGKFDTFITDPVETVAGMRLFISRCASTLKGKGAGGYFGLTHFESSLSKWFGVERDLLKMNFVITDILRDFNSYLLTGERILEKGFRIVTESPFKPKAPDTPWYKSTFIRLEAVKKPKPLIKEEVKWNRELYFDEDTYVALP